MAVSDYIKKYFAPSPDETRVRDVLNPSNLLSGTQKTGSSILGGLQSAGQSSLRGLSAAATGLYDIGEKSLGTIFPSAKQSLAENRPVLTPSSFFQKELYGTDKPITARSFGAEVGIPEKSKFAAPVGFALGIADLIPGGKITKTTAVGLLKNANKVDDVVRIMKQMMGVSDDVIKKFAPQAANLTDGKQLSSLVDEVVKESQSVGRMFNKAKGVLSGGAKSPASEAVAKGLTEEQFVKEQGTPLYHGTGEDFSQIKSKRQLRESGSDVQASNIGGDSPFIHLTPDKDFGESYGKARMFNIRGRSKVLEFRVQGKTLDLTKHGSEYTPEEKSMLMEMGNKLLEASGNRGPDAFIGGELYSLGKTPKLSMDMRNARIRFNDIEQSRLFTDILKEYGFSSFKFGDRGMSGGFINTIAAIPDYVKTTSQLRTEYADELTKSKPKATLPKANSAQQAIKDGLTEEQFVKGQKENILQHASDNPNLTKFEDLTKTNKVWQDKINRWKKLGEEHKTLKTVDELVGWENSDEFQKLNKELTFGIGKPPKVGGRGSNGGEGIYLSSKVDFWRGALEAEGKPLGEYTYDVLITNPKKRAEYFQPSGGGQQLPETVIQPNEGIILGKTGKYNLDSQLRTEYQAAKGLVKEIGAKERKFITSVKEALPKLQGKVAGQYIPRATDPLAIASRNFIIDDIIGAEKYVTDNTDDKAVAIATELVKKYGDDAARATDPAQANMLYDKAAEIANTLAPKLTEHGRSIQAASILGRMTPEGQLRFAAREIQKYNETARVKIPELSGEQSKKILEEMKVINDMPDGIEKAKKLQQLQDYVKSVVPTPLMKKMTAVWKAGLLTGVKTTGLNLFASLSHFTTEIAKNVPAAMVDSVASLFTGVRTKTFTLRGYGKGSMEGFKKGLEYFKTGFDERNIAAKLDYKKVNFGKGTVAKAFQVYTDTVFRAMGSSDQPFYYGALSGSLMDQGLAQGKNAGLKGKELIAFAEELIQSPTEQMIRYATADAATVVFQNETYLGKVAKGFQNIPIVGEIVVPFARTPSAVATQIINYSPIGIVKTIFQNIGKGKFDQRLFSEGIGRGVTGTGVMAIGVEMGRRGLVTLERPTTEKEQKLWELEGRKANSIKIGDTWRSPIVLGPAGNLLLLGAHFNRAVQTSGSPTEALSKTAFGGLKSFTEQTFLTGLNQANNALNDPERYADSYLGNMVGSLVPTIVSDVARATDGTERRAESKGGVLGSIPQRVQARIPGARQSLEPQINVLGEERKISGNPLEIMLDPTRPQKDLSTPLVTELRRLTVAGFNVSPTLLGDKKGFKALSPEENTELWKRVGEVINDKLTSLFGKEGYAKLSDEDKGKFVEKVVNKVKVNTRAKMVIKLTKGLRGEELKKRLSELKEGGLLNKEVYKKYVELR